jgi:predicted ATP-dependent endonuclease of OLD family
MKTFAPYFKAIQDGEKAAALKEIYESIQTTYPELPKATSGPAREKALREFEEAHPDLCEQLEAETQFFGFTKGTNLLAKHIQWVYIPAVKDASTEQQEGTKGALKDLLDRTIRSKVNFKDPIAALKKQVEEDYRKIIDSEKKSLADLEASMHKRLREWASPNAMLQLGWHYDENKSVVVNEPYARASLGEDNFIGEVARLGHGMQRSFLVALLHELAALNAAQGPTLLLGFEEPELYQHPPQAQHMSDVLESLAHATATNTQIVVSTHSPYFVSSRGFENVRAIRKHHIDKCSMVAATSYHKVEAIIAKALGTKPKLPAGTMAAIEQIMQPSQKELYFTRVAVFVEGLEDIGYIASHLTLQQHWLYFRRLGCHFIVTGGKTNMSRPLAIAKELCIRAFAVFDCDTDDEKQPKTQARDNLCIMRLCGIKDADPMPKEHLYFDNCVAWRTRIEDVIRAEAGDKCWQEVTSHVRETLGLQGIAQKNKLFIAAIMEELYKRKFVSAALTELSCRILAFAEHSNPEPEPILVEAVASGVQTGDQELI